MTSVMERQLPEVRRMSYHRLVHLPPPQLPALCSFLDSIHSDFLPFTGTLALRARVAAPLLPLEL
jgi:hypothetical protein